jgi:hypothetical protein
VSNQRLQQAESPASRQSTHGQLQQVNDAQAKMVQDLEQYLRQQDLDLNAAKAELDRNANSLAASQAEVRRLRAELSALAAEKLRVETRTAE